MDENESGDGTAREEMFEDVENLLPGQIKLVMLDSNGQPQGMFLTTVSTLSRADYNSQLYKIASEVRTRSDQRGVFYIDRAADTFHHILNYLRYETVPDEVNNNEGFRQQLLAEAKYYSIYGLIRQIGRRTELCSVSLARAVNDMLDGEVELIVGGTSFKTTTSTLRMAPQFSLLRQTGYRYEESDARGGVFCIDRGPEYFDHVLEYLRNGTVPIEEVRESSEFREALLKEARYYELSDMASKISENN